LGGVKVWCFKTFLAEGIIGGFQEILGKKKGPRFWEGPGAGEGAPKKEGKVSLNSPFFTFSLLRGF